MLQYRGVSLALLSLENFIKAAPRPKLNSLNVVVFKVSSREIGLVTPVLEDIHDIPVELDTVTFREPGIMGSTLIDNRTVRMIDLYELAKKARPDWFGQTQQVPQATQGSGKSKTKSILLAEDSNFFRTQLVSFLTGDGYEVVACEDGQEAWTTLQKNPKKFNLVLTDIEMPNMNGLELAKHIKSDPEVSHLPVVALTTLASDEDIRNGQQAGVNQYLIKMDRDELLATMREYFSKMEKQKAGV
ncbi:MAG: response regulator [Planctomycetes bacterium]|nr:response regulator [Planctomycetota bacterium]